MEALEHHVTSLELSKKLNELGVKQESQFYWIENILVFKSGTGFYAKNGAGMNLHPMINKAVSAFLSSELGKMLPYGYRTNRYQTSSEPIESGYICCPNTDRHTFCADTEADARAKMIIYLTENQLITLPK